MMPTHIVKVKYTTVSKSWPELSHGENGLHVNMFRPIVTLWIRT